MATFVFKAMDLAGMPAKGEVEAESKQDVANQLKERGPLLYPLRTDLALFVKGFHSVWVVLPRHVVHNVVVSDDLDRA